jgi:hypothetical protein
MKYCSNQSLFTWLSLHSLTVIQNTLQNQSRSVPEYFEDCCTFPRCNSAVKELTQAIAWNKDWSDHLVSLWHQTVNLCLDLLTDFNTACSFVSLHRQWRTRLGLLLAFQGYSPTQTHYTNQMKQERRLEKWPNKSGYSSIPPRGVHVEWKWKVMPVTTTRFSNSVNTFGFKSHLNDITK